MWTKIKWGIRILVVLIVGLFLHYTLPQHDIVRITETSNRITQIGPLPRRNGCRSRITAGGSRCFRPSPMR